MKIKAKKSLGQNFLIDDSILCKIVEIGNISENDIILEIGPGTGNLTEKIIKKNPKKFFVVEKDKNLSNLLKKKFGNKINIINNDILKCYNNFLFDTPIKVFGNLPYNISTKILISMIKINNLENFVKEFIFIFQKEVADRIMANENTKNYGRISILASWRLETKKILDISPSSFKPKPKVNSSLICLTPKSKFNNCINVKHLEHITNVFFNQRRKMIKKPMKLLFNDFENIANKLGLDLNIRPQNISKKKYLEISNFYKNLV